MRPASDMEFEEVAKITAWAIRALGTFWRNQPIFALLCLAETAILSPESPGSGEEHGMKRVVVAAMLVVLGNPALGYEVTEAPRYKLGQIIILGNDITRDRVILDAMDLAPGQVLSYPEIRLAEQRLR